MNATLLTRLSRLEHEERLRHAAGRRLAGQALLGRPPRRPTGWAARRRNPIQ